MKIGNRYMTLEFSDADGRLISVVNAAGREFIGGAKALPLVSMRVRNALGKAEDISSAVCIEDGKLQAPSGSKADARLDKQETIRMSDPGSQQVTFGRIERLTSEELHITAQQIGNLPIDVSVRIVLPAEGKLSYWNISVSNRSDREIEWIDVPGIKVPNDLIAAGGDARLLWPGNEGALIEDAAEKESSGFRYWDAQYPSRGIPGGIYPGPVPTQFMAYYGEKGGLYVGTHDPYGNVKSFEYELMPEGDIRLQMRQYLSAFGTGEMALEYPIVIGVFEGDWYDAADIYRNWFENREINVPAKIADNPDLPDWYRESPVVITYPVRGRHDMDDMVPNKLYPYTNALPVVERFSAKTDSKIMALLMHWESTAPWAPPYVWPPYGDAADFGVFADALHAEGNLLGVYCSGTGYTKQSNLIAEYNNDRKIEEEGLLKYMNAGPDGVVRISSICTGQRSGYDMCGSQEFTKNTVTAEMAKIVDGGVDYVQAMDQNHGGTTYFCCSRKHGHPAGPGKWQTEAMEDLYARLREMSHGKGKKVLFGCESVAAEPFIAGLLFSDARYELNYLYGRPVPLFAYLYHSYVNNFSGNQCCLNASFDNEDAPDNVLYRLAYSFSAGDMLTLVINEDGQIFWSWGENPDLPLPEQESILTFVRNANAWRRGEARKYLLSGEMRKPLATEGIPCHTYHLKNGVAYEAEEVLVSRWTASDRDENRMSAVTAENGASETVAASEKRSPSEGQFFANWTGEEQRVWVVLPVDTTRVRVFDRAEDYPGGDVDAGVEIAGGKIEIVIRPYSISLIEF